MTALGVGEIVRLIKDTGRFQAGEFFVCLDPRGPKGLEGFVIALASDGKRTALEASRLQRGPWND